MGVSPSHTFSVPSIHVSQSVSALQFPSQVREVPAWLLRLREICHIHVRVLHDNQPLLMVTRAYLLGMLLMALVLGILEAAMPLVNHPFAVWLHFGMVPLLMLLLGLHVLTDCVSCFFFLLPLSFGWMVAADVLYVGVVSFQTLSLGTALVAAVYLKPWWNLAAVVLVMAKECAVLAVQGYGGPARLFPLADIGRGIAVYRLLVFCCSAVPILILVCRITQFYSRDQRMREEVDQKLRQHRRQLQAEMALNRQLIRNILPEAVAGELIQLQTSGRSRNPAQAGLRASVCSATHHDDSQAPAYSSPQGIIARTHSNVVIAFGDIQGFTPLAESCSPTHLVSYLDRIFCYLDDACSVLDIEKIKTIGDCYMVAGFPVAQHDVVRTGSAVLDFCHTMHTVIQASPFDHRELSIRAGMDCGTVVAGIIGKTKFCYDIWGDAVNMASRMESTGMPGATQVTGDVHDLLAPHCDFASRGLVEVKGKGKVQTWLHHPTGYSAIPVEYKVRPHDCRSSGEKSGIVQTFRQHSDQIVQSNQLASGLRRMMSMMTVSEYGDSQDFADASHESQQHPHWVPESPQGAAAAAPAPHAIPFVVPSSFQEVFAAEPAAPEPARRGAFTAEFVMAQTKVRSVEDSLNLNVEDPSLETSQTMGSLTESQAANFPCRVSDKTPTTSSDFLHQQLQEGSMRRMSGPRSLSRASLTLATATAGNAAALSSLSVPRQSRERHVRRASRSSADHPSGATDTAPVNGANGAGSDAEQDPSPDRPPSLPAREGERRRSLDLRPVCQVPPSQRLYDFSGIRPRYHPSGVSERRRQASGTMALLGPLA